MKTDDSTPSATGKKVVNIFWFRRDLRLQDNAGLYHALKEKPRSPNFYF